MKSQHLFLAFFICIFSLSAEVPTNLKKYVSSDCNTLIGIDMKAVLAIPAIQAALTSGENKELKQLDDLGLKPQDIDSVIIGLNTEKLASDVMAFEKQPDLISISNVKEGITFDKLVTAAEKEKVKTAVKTVSGVRTVELNKDGKVFVMAELSPKTIAVGSKDMVMKAISLKSGQASGSISENLELSKLADAQKEIFWVVGAKPKTNPAAAGDEKPLDNPMNSLFGDLKLFTIGLTYTEKEVKLNSNLICNTEAGAAQMAMTGQLMTGFLAASEDSPVKADQIKFSTEKTTVNIKLNIDTAAILKAAAAAKNLAE